MSIYIKTKSTDEIQNNKIKAQIIVKSALCNRLYLTIQKINDKEWEVLVLHQTDKGPKFGNITNVTEGLIKPYNGTLTITQNVV